MKVRLAQALALAAVQVAICAGSAGALPDGRAYELVTRYEQGGHEVGLNGVEPIIGMPSASGDAFDWVALLGACCGAKNPDENLFRSERQATGWQTQAVTPEPSEPIEGFLVGQTPVFWTSDLSKTIFSTPSSYAPGDHRPKGGHAEDLYLVGPTGSPTWLSQGPFGTGSEPVLAEFAGATPDASEVVFNSAEPLTANATGLSPLGTASQYLYVRDVAAATTALVDVNNDGSLMSPYGATLGNGNSLKETPAPVDGTGTTTHAISQDGTKIFFETPPEGLEELPAGVAPHLYMRDLATSTTTPLDDPESDGSAQYEGASANGSLVFFTSDEGLDGASTANELYEYNTTSSPIGPAPPMSSMPIGSGGGVLGISAVSNDGSHVYFVAEGVRANNVNPDGQTALAGQPNLYEYVTSSGRTTFIATLLRTDVNSCEPTCGTGRNAGLVEEPDIGRLVYPTPDGSALVFESSANLTGQDPVPATMLTAEAKAEGHKLEVASTAGLAAGKVIAIGSGDSQEFYEIEAVDGPTELTLAYSSPGYNYGLVVDQPAGAPVSELNYEAYRYSPAEGSLVCVSCAPPGQTPEGDALLAAAGGGSYAPIGEPVTMNEDASEIFFADQEALVPEAVSSSSLEPDNVYEWEHGRISLIYADTTGLWFDGTDPSGDDVFFTTRKRLTPQDGELGSEGRFDIYDARVGGGFASPPVAPCMGAACRPEAGTVFFGVPASATVAGMSEAAVQSTDAPYFTLASITASERKLLARTGSITLSVHAISAGEVRAQAIARLDGRSQSVARVTAHLQGAGAVALTLHLSRKARSALARRGSLTLRLEVGFSASSILEVAELKLRTTHTRSTAKRFR